MIYECIFIVLNHFFLNFSENFVHQLSHDKNYKWLYNDHHRHHVVDYPPSRLVRSDHVESITKVPYLVIISTGYLFFYFIFNSYYYILFITHCSLYFMVISTLHSHYHLKDSPLERFDWFMRRRKLHHIHHLKTHKNFNLIFFTSDKLNQSYLKEYSSKYIID